MGHPDGVIWRHHLPWRGAPAVIAEPLRGTWLGALAELDPEAAIARLAAAWSHAPPGLRPVVDVLSAYVHPAIVGGYGQAFLELSSEAFRHDLPWVPRPWGGPWEPSSAVAREYLGPEDDDDLTDGEAVDLAEEGWFVEHEDDFDTDDLPPSVYLTAPSSARDLAPLVGLLPREFLALYEVLGCLAESAPGVAGSFVSPAELANAAGRGDLTVFEARNGDALLMAADGRTSWRRACGGPRVPVARSATELFSRYAECLGRSVPFDSYVG
ncbi:MAG: hypothetical protein M9894_11740 [Planctomycetes bacterium]|nr:hypothetical protein [Planctomycetota bacterium]